MSLAIRERDKYSRMWLCPDYATYSPGVQWLPVFRSLVAEDPAPGADPSQPTLIDVGCGTGAAGVELAAEGYRVTLHDFTQQQITTEANAVADVVIPPMPIWQLGPHEGHWDYGYCCDVLEHLPTQMTMLAVDRLMSCCQRVFLTIATEPDAFGMRIGEPLHLTVQPFVWWRDALREVTTVRDARDGLNTAIFYLGDDAD